LSSEQLAGTVEPRQIFDTHVTDLQKFLQFMRDDLAIPKTNVLAWSMGSTTVVGCFTPEHLSTTQSLLPFMKRIILWDAPSIGFGIPPTPTAKALFSREHFIEYVASFCIYPEEYLMSRVPGVATQIFPFQGSTLDDPQYPVWAKKAVDLHSIAGNNRSNISNDPTTVQQKYREAHHNLAKAAVEKQVLYGTRAIPENLEGAWVSRDWIVEGGGSCKVIVMEGLNHFAHFHEPVKMWNALRE
jgi:hypothetical protein